MLWHHYPEEISAVALLYKAGSIHDPPGRTGVAHILEHLMFNGSLNYAPFSMYIDAWGGQDNAFTDRDITVYHSVVPKERLKDLLRLEVDRMENLLLSNFEAEKEVIVEEHLLSENEDDELLWTEVFAQLWPDSSYANPVSGWLEDVRNLTLGDVQEFYRKFYRPNNALLVIATAYEFETVRNMVEDLFSPLSPRSTPIPFKCSDAPYSWYKEVEVRANRPRRFILAVRLKEPSLRYNAALNLFTRMLDLERSSPLWPLVESGDLELFSVRNYEYSGGNVLAVIGEVAAGNHVPSHAILDILIGFEPNEGSLERVKRMLKSEFIFSYEEAESVALNSALTYYLFGKLPSIQESLGIYEDIRTTDLREIQRQIEISPKVTVRYR
ncbi:MAG: insulinase family protein [Thermotogae bacterium]|nr:insulinase family protein [Thermotogota bacterium]